MQAKIPMPYIQFKEKEVVGILDFIYGFCGIIDPAETDFCNFRIDFIGEYDAKCETNLGCEPGP
jgi:hypothetical protein